MQDNDIEETSLLLIIGEPTTGGVCRLSTLLANQLIDNYEVTLLATDEDIPYELDHRIEVVTGGDLLYSFGLGHAMKNLFLFPLIALRHDHDVIVNLSGAYPSTVFLDRLGLNAVHYSHHAFDTTEAFDGDGLLERFYCNTIDEIQNWAIGKQVPVLSNSARTRREVMERYEIEVFRSYPPVDVDTFTPVESKDGYTLLSGRYHPDKQIDDALEHIADSDIVVAGAVADETYYQDLVETYPCVEFRRDLPEEEWVSLHQRAKAYVFTNPEEHFGIAPAEAMSCGIPAVIPEGAGISEIITDGVNGYLTHPNFADLNEKVEMAKSSDESVRKRARKTIVNHCAPSALAQDLAIAVELAKLSGNCIDRSKFDNLLNIFELEETRMKEVITEFGYRLSTNR